MRFQIGDGPVYNSTTLDEVTLSQWLRFERETEQFGRKFTVSDVMTLAQDIESLKPAERAQHPDMLWLTAISVWASRVQAGDPVTFDQAVDFPMGKLTMMPDPQDHQEPANPTKARSRKGSGQGGRSRPAGRAATASAVASTNA